MSCCPMLVPKIAEPDASAFALTSALSVVTRSVRMRVGVVGYLLTVFVLTYALMGPVAAAFACIEIVKQGHDRKVANLIATGLLRFKARLAGAGLLPLEKQSDTFV